MTETPKQTWTSGVCESCLKEKQVRTVYLSDGCLPFDLCDYCIDEQWDDEGNPRETE